MAELMDKKWKVSVLTPVHNTPINLLQRAFDSLLVQSYGFSDIQWVVVLHNCDDDYIQSAKQLFEGYPNICCSIENAPGTGVSYARNATLKIAEGEYVFFLDSDDEFKQDCVKKVVSEMERTKSSSALFAAEEIIFEMKRVMWTDTKVTGETVCLDRGDSRIEKSLCLGGLMLWTRCYRRDVIVKNSITFNESINYGEDFLFNITATGFSDRICVIPKFCGCVHYVGIGMTKDIGQDINKNYLINASEGVKEDSTGVFLYRIFRYGKSFGIDLSNVMWALLSWFGRAYFFSGTVDDKIQKNYIKSVRKLVEQLSAPVMECKEYQKEADEYYHFVMAYCQMKTTKKAPAKTNKGNAKLRALLDPSRYSASDISEKDLNRIIGLYGSSVEDIYDLGAGQRWMLEEVKDTKNAFFLQILTKAVINFDPPAFRQRADEVCEKYENLRSAFVIRNMDNIYRVVLKDRHPEINCFDLSELSMEEFDKKINELMEADRNRGIDLEKDPLLRINVYKSCEEDTYAIIVSQPHANSDGTSLGILFADLFVGYALDMNGIDKIIDEQSYRAYAKHLSKVDTGKELEFWKDKLTGMDEDQLLPGQIENTLDYDVAAFPVEFSEKEMSILKNAQKKYGVTRFILLQGLWGITIAKLKKRDHVVFGAITSGRDAEVSDSMRLAGGFINALPVRVNVEEDMPLKDFFKNLQMEFVECMNNSHCSPGQIKKALGRDRDIFSHILNNHNFAKPRSGNFSQGGFEGLRFIGGAVYDNLSADLCLYFTNVKHSDGISFSYNRRAFSPEVIEILSKDYLSMIDALDSMEDDMKIGMFPDLDAEAIYTAKSTRDMEQLRIAEIFNNSPIFSSASDEELIDLSEKSYISHNTQDEIIKGNSKKMEEVLVLIKGMALVYAETKDGWNNPLFVKKDGSILDYSVLFDDYNNSVISVISNEAVILHIPLDSIEEFLDAHSESMKMVASYINDERNRFMKLWENMK